MKNLYNEFRNGDFYTRLSFFIMGAAPLRYGQYLKGIVWLATEIAFYIYLFSRGIHTLAGLRHLGTTRQGWVYDEEQGIDILQQGDNSMLILLYGVFAIFIIALFLFMWSASVHGAFDLQRKKERNEPVPSLRQELVQFSDSRLHNVLLSLPTAGVLIFTVLPLSFMILIAFTNFDNLHQPPGNLFTWVGLDNFKAMLSSGSLLGKTFWPILGWTLVWAVFATALNYFLGMLLAVLINKKGIRFKALFRTIFVLSIAMPQFVSLLIMRNVLDNDGPLNVLLQALNLTDGKILFLTDATLARISVIIINLWIGIPYSMLITSGILMNIPSDLYESAKIDGASAAVTYFKITLPYVVFVTAPYLITQFIGNINNFNVIYFLTAGGPSTLDYYQAGKTDLLVTWLYKLTVNSKDYSYASTIGILVFVLSAVFSLIAYRRTSAYKNEEEFQ